MPEGDEAAVAKPPPFVKPLTSGFDVDEDNTVGARLDRATIQRVRQRLAKIDAARAAADRKSRDSYLG